MGCAFSNSRSVYEGDAQVFSENDDRRGSGRLRFVARKMAEGKYSGEIGVMATKAQEVSSFFGRTSFIDVLDTLGSSLSNLNPNGGFITGIAMRGNKVSILAFEVANTIAKGAKLMQSLSDENILFLKEEILASEGVQRLLFADQKELMKIAASDKRDELHVFSVEVARFGDLCKDPEWHNLTRFFQRLDSDTTPPEKLQVEAHTAMQELLSLAQLTSDLYHELHTLDRYEKDHNRNLHDEESFSTASKGEGVLFLKNQRKIVKSLKRRSLWSRHLDEVVEKLVDIVVYLHKEISVAFGLTGLSHLGCTLTHGSSILGASGLSLHYANIINQIENIVSRPIPLPANTRNTLYNGLPPGVKAALRSRIHSSSAKKLSVAQIKTEMQKTLQWLYPMAENTIKAHQGFGWVGEWANMGTEVSKKPLQQLSAPRVQTLYYADKEKTEEHILHLVVLLHSLVEQVKNTGFGFKSGKHNYQEELGVGPSPDASRGMLNHKDTVISLTQEDIQMLESTTYRMNALGRSKSHGYLISKMRNRSKRRCRPSRSTNSSPMRDATSTDFRFERRQFLDLIDGLEVLDPYPAPFCK